MPREARRIRRELTPAERERWLRAVRESEAEKEELLAKARKYRKQQGTKRPVSG